MKRLHRPDLYAWSVFNTARNIDFHGFLWARAGGNVAVDPLPLSDHDWDHLRSLGGLAYIVVTNSDHARDTELIARETGARVLGPAAEREAFPIACDDWLDAGDQPFPDLLVHTLHGSKTPGELALLLGKDTLITGDLIRAHEGGKLCILPDAVLADRAAALDSVSRMAALPGVDAVLVGDGWPIFRGGNDALRELADELAAS